ncbi:hypothetical protein AHAS_Ahas08G0081200 [Arachis hypogaea]
MLASSAADQLAKWMCLIDGFGSCTRTLFENEAALVNKGRIRLKKESRSSTKKQTLDFDGQYVTEAMYHIPPTPSMATAREESENVMFGALDNLFANTKIKPKDIGVLIVNCRVIAIDLAKDMLQVHRNTYAVVVSTENITQNWYFGNKKSMLIPNCLFRVGGSAVLLSNKGSVKRRAKYKLVHVVRTHKDADDKAFRCVYQEQDDDGKTGVSLSKDLMAIAGGALKTNITTLGSLVLPISEQLLFFATLVVKKLLNAKVKP